MILYRFKYKKIPVFVKKLIIKLSQISLGIYLISFIFDNMFYTYLMQHTNNYTQRFLAYPFITIGVFVFSSLLSWSVYLIKDFFLKAINLIQKRILITNK